MKIAFFDTKPYDKTWFKPLSKEYDIQIKFHEFRLNEDTVVVARGCEAVCVFVNDNVNENMVDLLVKQGVKLILLRSAGFNHVDLKACEGKLTVMRVPNYSPEAVAEYTMGLILTVNRQIHRAYMRTRDFNYSIQGLMGIDLVGKTVGVIGTGKIGQMLIDILKGFKMKILAYDPYPADGLDVEYTDLDTLLANSDVITLHCPLTKDTQNLIRKETIEKMKDGVILVNTSRGDLVDTEALLDALAEQKFSGVGLDVYEEEEDYFFEDCSNEWITDDHLLKLTAYNQVIITSHQAFFTKDAMEQIAKTTLENAKAFACGGELVNAVRNEK